jgi:hypothetical protein
MRINKDGTIKNSRPSKPIVDGDVEFINGFEMGPLGQLHVRRLKDKSGAIYRLELTNDEMRRLVNMMTTSYVLRRLEPVEAAQFVKLLQKLYPE